MNLFWQISILVIGIVTVSFLGAWCLGSFIHHMDQLELKKQEEKRTQ